MGWGLMTVLSGAIRAGHTRNVAWLLPMGVAGSVASSGRTARRRWRSIAAPVLSSQAGLESLIGDAVVRGGGILADPVARTRARHSALASLR